VWLAAAALALAIGDAHAWSWAEHLRTGETAYLRACERVAEEIATSPRHFADPDVTLRFEIACGNLDVRARQYGQITALAGDHTGRPDDFFEVAGAGRIASRRNYYTLALVNSTHFHPIATRHWRELHKQALERARAASRLTGFDLIEGYERAFYDSGFADHFLHDAFSAGHMGFNRPGSSAGAAKAFHDAWNRRGRYVRDRRGATWKTYGDGLLDHPENREGRRHLVETATLSAYGLVKTFVEGERSPDHEMEIWRAVPFTIVAPELESHLATLLPGDRAAAMKFESLLAIHRPAHKDRTAEVWLFGFSAAREPTEPTLGTLLGFDLAIPFVPAQTYVGVGATLRDSRGAPHLAGEVGFIAGLGITSDGLLSHEVNGGLLWVLTTEDLVGAAHITYRFNLELGPYLIRVQAGPALVFPNAAPGLYLGVGGGYVFSAAGGGAM
jgi:hypothetical protein